MKLIRAFAVCGAAALASSLSPGIAPPAAAAGVLVASRGTPTSLGMTVTAVPGQTLPLGALFTPVAAGLLPQDVNVVVTLTGGLTFPDGTQVTGTQGPTALQNALGIPVTTKGSGVATLKVTALVNNSPITDEAVTAVAVPAPAPGQVRLVSSVGTAAATAGQTVSLGSLFKPVDVPKEFDVRKTTIEVTLTGGLVFPSGYQSINWSSSSTPDVMKTALLSTMTANRSGTATFKVRAVTTNFDIIDEATVAVAVTVTAPAPPPVPGPAPTVAPAPGATAAPAPAGNRAPTATGKSVVAKASTTTAIVLKGTDPKGAKLVYSVVDFPENGRLTGRAPNLSYIPDKAFVGTDAFTFTVSDGVSTSEKAVVSITVISAKKAVAKKAVVRKTTKKK